MWMLILLVILPSCAFAQERLPVVSSISPTSTTAGAVITLDVNGSNFSTSSAVTWNGVRQPSVYVSSRLLRLSVAPSLVSVAGTAKVGAYTPGETGGDSTSTLPFTISPSTTVPTTITSSIPPGATAAVVAELPRYTVDTTFPNTTGYVIKTVCASGCNYSTVQAAVNAIPADRGNVMGEIIALAPGVTFTASVSFPAYQMEPGKWIIITTNTPSANLPALGVRVNPSYSPILAKMITKTVNQAAVKIAPGGNHYWFVGLEIAVDPSIPLFQDATIKIGSSETGVSELPHHIVIDRCFVHGNPTGNIRRGIAANGISVAIINSWISDYHDTGSDTQAVWAHNTPGPILIHNNELQASGENVMFGGSPPLITGVVPSDITITRNHFFKPLSWFLSSPSYAGTPWIVKNLFEIKNAQRVLLQGNVLENSWAHAQNGFAIVLTPRAEGGACPWCTNADVTIAYNVIRHCGNGIEILASDNFSPSQPTQRMHIHDNLLQDINGSTWGGGAGRFLLVVGNDPAARDIIINHNTALNSGNTLIAGEIPHTNFNFVFTNNIAGHNEYGVFGSAVGSGSKALDTYFPAAQFSKNALVNLPGSISPSTYPSGTYLLPSWNDLSFANLPSCRDASSGANSISMCSLTPTSPLLTSTDGRPLGVDIGKLLPAVAGVAP